MCILESEMCALDAISNFCNSEEAKECPGKVLCCGFSLWRDTCDLIYTLCVCEARDPTVLYPR